MIGKQNNQYNELYKYLEKQQPLNKKLITKKKIKKNKFDNFVKDFKINSDVPGKQFKRPLLKESKGFNVSHFESLMRAKLIDSFKKSQNYNRPYISVGELYSCIRQCYYSRMKYSFDDDKLYKFSYLYLILEVGKLVHELIQKLYKFDEIEKVIISKKFHVKGRIDGIKKDYAIEIKTIDNDKFKNQYIKEHYIQACIYAYILNTEYNYSLKYITLIYVSRNLKKIVPFDLPINNDLALKALNNAPILKSALDSFKVPDPYGSTKDLCYFCLYSKHCKKDQCIKVKQPFKAKYVDKIKNNKKSDIKYPNIKTAFLL